MCIRDRSKFIGEDREDQESSFDLQDGQLVIWAWIGLAKLHFQAADCPAESVLQALRNLISQLFQHLSSLSLCYLECLLVTAVLCQSVEVSRGLLKGVPLSILKGQQREQNVVDEGEGVGGLEGLRPDEQAEAHH